MRNRAGGGTGAPWVSTAQPQCCRETSSPQIPVPLQGILEANLAQPPPPQLPDLGHETETRQIAKQDLLKAWGKTQQHELLL